MSADIIYQAALRENVQSFLKEEGFSRKDNTFRRIEAEVVDLIVPQKSRKSTSHEIVFAVNLGVASKRLLSRSDVASSNCAIEDCHWRKRLAKVGMTEEAWWIVHDRDSAQRAASEVVDALRFQGLSALYALSEDKAIRDMWLSGQSPGLTEVQRLVNLSVLLRALGPSDKAIIVIGSLKQIARVNPLPIILTYLKELGEVP